MVDYSKWRKIEFSDDEDDTHPNIDTTSLFRWRHKARLERAESQRQSRQELATRKAELVRKLATGLTAEEQDALKAEVAEKRGQIGHDREDSAVECGHHLSGLAWSSTVLNKKCITPAASRHRRTRGGEH
jgi:hypothetical protein